VDPSLLQATWYCNEKTPPKTPQLYGLAERMNKTLLEKVRCMISDAKLPKHFWGEASLYTVMHVINLTPTVILDSEVPNKIWFGKNVSYDHLHVFDCKAFFHILRDERSKLDAKIRQCIFIGYGEDGFGYRFYDPIEKKLVRSRDVQFMKDQTIEDIDKVEKTRWIFKMKQDANSTFLKYKARLVVKGFRQKKGC